MFVINYVVWSMIIAGSLESMAHLFYSCYKFIRNASKTLLVRSSPIIEWIIYMSPFVNVAARYSSVYRCGFSTWRDGSGYAPVGWLIRSIPWKNLNYLVSRSSLIWISIIGSTFSSSSSSIIYIRGLLIYGLYCGSLLALSVVATYNIFWFLAYYLILSDYLWGIE